LSSLGRKAVLICTTVCFVAVTTGLMLQLHLLGDAHSKKHDSEHCSVCQQLLIAPGKFVLEPELTLEMAVQIEHYVNFHPTIRIKQFHYQQFGPRPPPTAL
jgi:hypothetical protein